ncbi:MAG: lmo0937 family membrane protein, partial [Pseudorhizobium sp.]
PYPTNDMTRAQFDESVKKPACTASLLGLLQCRLHFPEFGTYRRVQHSCYDLMSDRRPPMLWTIAIILLCLWAVGLAFKVAGALIHLLLVIALIVVLIKVFNGRRAG